MACLRLQFGLPWALLQCLDCQPRVKLMWSSAEIAYCTRSRHREQSFIESLAVGKSPDDDQHNLEQLQGGQIAPLILSRQM